MNVIESELRRPWGRGHRLWHLALVTLLVPLVGCGDDRDPVPAETEVVAVDDTGTAQVVVPPDLLPEPEPPEPVTPEPDTIYYDLSQVEWYRRGEPIIIDDVRYLPGRVEATGERRLQRKGEYHGVDYYLTEGANDPPDTVFVPVFPGYWLPFTREHAPEDTGD